MSNEWIAACGLDCETCEIRRIPFDNKAAEGCVNWFRSMGWLKPDEGKAVIIERGMYCTGCRGDRSIHWSTGDDGKVSCGILECCVDLKGLQYCSECFEFPCERLTEWSKKNEEYGKAYARLEAMHANGLKD